MNGEQRHTDWPGTLSKAIDQPIAVMQQLQPSNNTCVHNIIMCTSDSALVTDYVHVINANTRLNWTECSKITFLTHPLVSPPTTAKPLADKLSRRRLLRENVCGLGTHVTYSESASLALSVPSGPSVWTESGLRISALSDGRRNSCPRIISC